MSAAGALLIHAVLLLSTDGIQGGEDLRPHLRLMQLMSQAPGLRSVYAPAYHAFGALALPWLGLAATPKVFAWIAAAALIGGFRFFQRSAGLPDAASAVFAWSPYLFSLTWCAPKVEAAGYALAFSGLGWLLRRRPAALALTLVATFWMHTAAALFLGLAGGVLALARRDGRALLGLAAGTLGSLPLPGAHLAAGCSVSEALLFSQGDYLRHAPAAIDAARLGRVAVLAGPIALGAALAGAPLLWRRNRAVSALCLSVVALYLNELWLAPFGARTTLDLMRGLTLLCFAAAIAAGTALAARPRIAPALLAACAAWGLCAALWSVPNSCHVRAFTPAEISATAIDRCSFRWRNTIARGRRPNSPLPGAAIPSL